MNKILFVLLLFTFIINFEQTFSKCQKKSSNKCGKCHVCKIAKPNCSPENCNFRQDCAVEREWYETMQYPSYRNWKLWNMLTR